MGDGQFHPAEIKIMTSADVHRMRFTPFLLAKASQLIRSNHRGIISFGDFFRVPEMVIVPVGEQNVITLQFFGFDSCHPVAGDEGVNQKFVFICLYQKAGVAVKGQFNQKTSFSSIHSRQLIPCKLQ